MAIREGQERGEISGGTHGGARNFSRETGSLEPESVTKYGTKAELNGVKSNKGASRLGIYDLTDNVSDAQFEEAVAEAKAAALELH
ncbi:hypothetical protein ACPXB3_05790 [Gordonia sp. DT219]|uniref:hypothetical protein n=1 Tax=Gordonia sp. DT219 TaxID=3416658 RepID=UPI003CF3BC8D